MVRPRMGFVFAALSALPLSACGTFDWTAKPSGTMKGTLQIEWVGSDRFVYRPLASDPLVYRAAGKPDVVPVAMYTDGGSIPRIFWSGKGLSPWTYGPAYILHDFLFNEHRCGRGQGVTFEDANLVLYDSIRILREKKIVEDAPDAPRLIKAAVDRFGRNAWEKGDCNEAPPPLGLKSARAGERTAPQVVGTITLGK